MSLRTVASKDLTGVSRSRGLWILATLLSLLFATIAYGFEAYRVTPSESVQELFSTLVVLLSLLLPIVALVSSYMAIAGERESGGVKFLLGFPNTRRDVFLGKLGSRLLAVAVGLCFMFGAATAVSVAKHGVFLWATVLGLLAVTLLYGTVFVGVAVAVSATFAARSRAIGAAIGSYFLLVLLYVVPGVRISDIVKWLHTTVLGFDANPDLYSAVTYTSPYVAYQKATNLVFPPEQQTTVFRRASEAAGDLPVYLTDEFSLVVFAVWIALPLFVGYRRFDRADLE